VTEPGYERICNPEVYQENHPENRADVGFHEKRISIKNEFFPEKEKIIKPLSMRLETEFLFAAKFVREFL